MERSGCIEMHWFYRCQSIPVSLNGSDWQHIACRELQTFVSWLRSFAAKSFPFSRSSSSFTFYVNSAKLVQHLAFFKGIVFFKSISSRHRRKWFNQSTNQLNWIQIKFLKRLLGWERPSYFEKVSAICFLPIQRPSMMIIHEASFYFRDFRWEGV